MSEAGEWTPFDYGDKQANPLPDAYEMVFVVERYYADGVTIGWWADGWWEVPGYKDNCSVSHWMPIQLPDLPAGALDDPDGVVL